MKNQSQLLFIKIIEVQSITKNQIITIQTIISQKGLRDEKETIVSAVSGMRTSSVKELYFDEAVQLINFLNGQYKLNENDKRQKMQRHIFAMAHELGWIKKGLKFTDGQLKEQNNYDAVHEWIVKYGYLHKPLKEYSYNELPALVTAFKNMYISKLKTNDKK